MRSMAAASIGRAPAFVRRAWGSTTRATRAMIRLHRLGNFLDVNKSACPIISSQQEHGNISILRDYTGIARGGSRDAGICLMFLVIGCSCRERTCAARTELLEGWSEARSGRRGHTYVLEAGDFDSTVNEPNYTDESDTTSSD